MITLYITIFLTALAGTYCALELREYVNRRIAIYQARKAEENYMEMARRKISKI